MVWSNTHFFTFVSVTEARYVRLITIDHWSDDMTFPKEYADDGLAPIVTQKIWVYRFSHEGH